MIEETGHFYRAKICDFGFSVPLSELEEVQKTPIVSAPWRILAPEVGSSSKWSIASDIWSFALLMYSVSTRKRPYENLTTNEVKARLLSGIPPHLEYDSSPYKDHISRMLSLDPKARGDMELNCSSLENMLEVQ
uniref:Protein kinase domain-containing protein n=1 Tax=Arcella intermedia TaxID=1963864 RepID=A0A6B2LNQ5_9EUKA